jgi:hypothetical protein
MTNDLAPAQKVRGVTMSLRFDLFKLIKFEHSLTVSLMGIVAALGGATAIVYVATRFGSHHDKPAVPAAAPADATASGGVSLVK